MEPDLVCVSGHSMWAARPCGCCWAFATIGVTECIVGMSLGQPISLSEQQLIDCDRAGEGAAVLTWCDLGSSPLTLFRACVQGRLWYALSTLFLCVQRPGTTWAAEGGDFEGGVDYIVDNGGIDTEADYPYLAHRRPLHVRAHPPNLAVFTVPAAPALHWALARRSWARG